MYKLPPIKVRFIVNTLLLFASIATVYLIFCTNLLTNSTIKPSGKNNRQGNKLIQTSNLVPSNKQALNDNNIWLIFTKVTKQWPLRYKFHNLLENILNISSVPLKFHIIVDDASKSLATNEISDVVSHSNKPILYKLYDFETCAQTINDIVQTMTPFFSSKPGTYYSDALFYLSLGLYRLAPLTQTKAVLLDCDLYFKQDIRLLFDEFKKFKPSHLFGLAPELTPVYRHVLGKYRRKHKQTTFGDFIHSTNLENSTFRHPRGFQGYNSGVVLMDLDAIRNSVIYTKILNGSNVEALMNKYQFQGAHLGDQDFYTLIGYEYPHLVHTLDCKFNRQLCTWWKQHGYSAVFDDYFRCEERPVILHGNCNTIIPKS